MQLQTIDGLTDNETTAVEASIANPVEHLVFPVPCLQGDYDVERDPMRQADNLNSATEATGRKK